MQAVIYNIGQKWLLPGEEAEHSFEQQYISLREKEKRICSDEEVTRLPFVAKDHPHYKEWEMRRQSCQRLLQYIERKKVPLKILEVGCGNGWLSHRISVISGTFVTGIDINAFELKQAARVFAGAPGLQFVFGSLDTEELRNKHFDMIVFAASIQYFHSFTIAMQQAMRLLKPHGEIHILDSHFYSKKELQQAEQRTKKYFDSIGCPAMSRQYFHHSVDALSRFDYRVLYKPPGLSKWMGVKKNPFTWLVIQKKNSA